MAIYGGLLSKKVAGLCKYLSMRLYPLVVAREVVVMAFVIERCVWQFGESKTGGCEVVKRVFIYTYP